MTDDLYSDSAATETTGEALPPPVFTGRRLVVLMDSLEADPKDSLDGPAADSIFRTWLAAWHPAVLSHLCELPKFRGPIFDPQSPEENTAFLVPGRMLDQLPTSFLNQAEDCQSPVVVISEDEASSLAELLRRLRGNDLADDCDSFQELVQDFQALGLARLWLHSTSVALGHVDVINHDDLINETLSGVRCWKARDFSAAENHLRAAFEVLLRARERFYPVDSYLLDLILTHIDTAPEELSVTLADESPKTIVGAANVLEKLAETSPQTLDRIKQGVDGGWLDLAGGPADEEPEHLLPLESVRQLYRSGDAIYRRRMDDRSVETLFHRQFALYPAQPLLARRLGFRFGLPQAFDGSTFPIRRESKILWASPDGTTLEALTRVPFQADESINGLRFAWVLGKSMRDDHVALACWLRWPGQPPKWLEYLRKIQSYAPVFGRMQTAGDFFSQTDRPFDTMTPEIDAFECNTLESALASDNENPVSRLAERFTNRSIYDTLSWFFALACWLEVDIGKSAKAAENLLIDEPAGAESTDLARQTTLDIAEKLASMVMTDAPDGTPGSLVFNPCAVARRVPVVLDQAAPDLRLCDSVQAAQFLAEGTLVVVDLPANGYAWVPHFANVDDPITPMGLLRYDFEANQIIHPHFVVSIDANTGGFKGLKRPGEPQARMGQQLSLIGVGGASDAACMIQEGNPDVCYGGPARMEVRTRGRVVDPSDSSRTVARFEQVYEANLGRPTLNLTVHLSEIDESFFSSSHAAYSSWGRALVCRWAWRESDARLRRLSHLQAHPSTANRPTTPEALEIGHENKRITILPQGLPFHRRHGQRMLDTVLLTGREQARSFKLALVLDLEFPHQAVQDELTPPVVVPVRTGPPVGGHRGWFYHLDHRNVTMSKVEYLASGTEGRGGSVVFHLVESAGRAARVRLRTMLNPTYARQIDDRGQTVIDLSVSDDAVDVDLTPYEIARVEVGIS